MSSRNSASLGIVEKCDLVPVARSTYSHILVSLPFSLILSRLEVVVQNRISDAHKGSSMARIMDQNNRTVLRGWYCMVWLEIQGNDFRDTYIGLLPSDGISQASAHFQSIFRCICMNQRYNVARMQDALLRVQLQPFELLNSAYRPL